MKIKKLIPLVLLSLFITGCNIEEPIKLETITDEVVIDSIYYDEPHTRFVHAGKSLMPIYDDEDFEVKVIYKDKSYYFTDEESYYKALNTKDEKIDAKIRVKYYEDGDITYDVISIGGK